MFFSKLKGIETLCLTLVLCALVVTTIYYDKTMNTRHLSQIDAIRDMLLAGDSVTPLQALNSVGCFRLASVINRLRQEGLDIVTNIIEDYSKENVVRYAEYHIRTVKE